VWCSLRRCIAAPSVEIPCEQFSSALMATMARTLRHRPEPLRTCPTLAFMAYSLASWDAAMARSNYSRPNNFKFKSSSSLPLKSQTLIKLQIFIGKRLTFYYYSEIEILQSNLPTIILQLKFFKLIMFKTDCKQSLVEVSTRVKVQVPVSSCIDSKLEQVHLRGLS
jgi:hypothetical protein